MGNSAQPLVEVFFVEEYDRRVDEAEEYSITRLKKSARHYKRLEGKYPPKGPCRGQGPWLSECLRFAEDPENYRSPGEETDSTDPDRPDVTVRKVKRRAIRRGVETR